MNLFKNLLRREAVRAADTQGVPATTAPQTEQPRGERGGTYEERVVYARDPQTALTVSAVYRAVELRAKTEAQFLIQYQRKDPDGGNFVADMRGTGRALNYLLQEQPNPLSTSSSIIEQVVIRRLLIGNAFIYIERDEWGDPVALWLAECGGYNRMNGTYSLTWLDEKGMQWRVDAPRSDVLHFANTFRSFDGFWGLSTLQYAFQTLSLNKTQSAQALENAAKGGRMKLIIGEEKPASGPGTLAFGMFNKETMDSYAKEVQEKLYSGDVVALRGLERIQNISMSSAEMQMIEWMNMTQDDVARFFGTPRPMLMLDTNSHYTTYTNATLEYLQRTVQPDITEMEQEFNRKLVGQRAFGTRRIHMCEQPLLRLDKEAQARVDQLQLQTGAATVNEIRAQYDRPSVEGGDKIYLSTNLAELGSDKLRTTGGSPAEPTPNPEEPKGGEE